MNTSKFKQLVEGLLQEEIPSQPEQDKKNVVDTKSELQKYFRELSVKVSGLKGTDSKEIQSFATLINGIIQDLEKGSLSPTLQQVLKVYDSRTKNLG